MLETKKEAETDVYESLGIYVSEDEAEISDLCKKANEVSSCGTKEEVLSKLSSWDSETAIEVCYMFFPEERGQMPELDFESELKIYSERVWKILTERETEEVSLEDQMPSLELEETAESESNETESPASEDEARAKVRIVLDALKAESEENQREEMLRRIEDAGLIAAICEELYGRDYLKELLIKEVCRKKGDRKTEAGDATAESKPVSVEEFKKAFDELERGRIFVNIPELRKQLAWPHDVFDDMIRGLRKERKIQLHVTDLTVYDPEEFIYDEDDNSRMGMVSWKKSA